jgi:hypothetical protein
LYHKPSCTNHPWTRRKKKKQVVLIWSAQFYLVANDEEELGCHWTTFANARLKQESQMKSPEDVRGGSKHNETLQHPWQTTPFVKDSILCMPRQEED